MIRNRHVEKALTNTPSLIRKTNPSHRPNHGQRENTRIPDLLLSSILLLTVCGCGLLSACTAKEPTDTSASSAVLSTASGALLPETGEAAASSQLPAEVPFSKYQFDLTETEDVKPEHQLAYLANVDRAVIFGGETSPYYIEGSFTGTKVYSIWSPATNFSFQETAVINDYAYSMDKTSIVFRVKEEGSSLINLMYFDGSKAYKVSACSGYYCISSDGSAAAYIRDGSLFVWNYSTKESRLITEDATECFALSPSGKYICYSTGKDFSCYCAPIGGDSIQIGTSCQPIALTDDGSLVYYFEGSGGRGKLCTYYSGTTQVLDESASIIKSSLTFNRDCTQIVFSMDGSYYFSMNGGKPIRATGGDVIDTNSKYYVNDSFVRLIKLNGRTITPYFVDNKNLCNLLFQNGAALSYFDKDLNVFSFSILDSSEGYLSDGGKGLLYISDEPHADPYKSTYVFVSDFSDPVCSERILADPYIVAAILTANDTIYYRNDIGQLYVIRGSAEPVKIDTYVSGLATMVVGDTIYVYYLKDHLEDDSYTLCCVEDIPDARSFVIDKGVYDIDICDAGLVYYKNRCGVFPDNSTSDVYFADDGLHGECVFNLFS